MAASPNQPSLNGDAFASPEAMARVAGQIHGMFLKEFLSFRRKSPTEQQTTVEGAVSQLETSGALSASEASQVQELMGLFGDATLTTEIVPAFRDLHARVRQGAAGPLATAIFGIAEDSLGAGSAVVAARASSVVKEDVWGAVLGGTVGALGGGIGGAVGGAILGGGLLSYAAAVS